MPAQVNVVPHDPNWRTIFVKESERIRRAMGEICVDMQHIGSTAIPGIFAKPVIDMLVEVTDLSFLDNRTSSMEELGYESLGEFGIAGRRYFRKDNEQGFRAYQIHAFESESEHLARHLGFRDYLISHCERAREYSELKRDLAEKFPDDMESYIVGKDAFIKETERLSIGKS